MNPNVTVYTSPLCMPCRTTKRHLDKHGVPYTEVDATLHRDAHQYIKRLGYTQTPVVTVELPDGLDHWSGYKPDRLDAIVYLAADRSAP